VTSPSIPEAALRLFPGYAAADLDPEGAATLVISRLLEDGDAADLAWLTGVFPEPALGDWLARHGGRLLSRRSRAFWEVVLGRAASPAATGAGALWPF
jgi:hypothetical protein